MWNTKLGFIISPLMWLRYRRVVLNFRVFDYVFQVWLWGVRYFILPSSKEQNFVLYEFLFWRPRMTKESIDSLEV